MRHKLNELSLSISDKTLDSNKFINNKRRLYGFYSYAAVALMALVPASSAFAGTQSLIKELISTPTPQVGEEVEYRLSFQCSGLVSDCGELSITDTLPAGMTLVSCTGAPPVFTLNCPPGGTTLGITKGYVGDANGAYSDGNTAVMVVKARIGLDVVPGVALTNEAASTITNADLPANLNITSTAGTVTVGDPTPNWSLEKRRTSPSINLSPTWDTDVSYEVKLCSNSAIGNVDLTNVHLVDVYPAGANIINEPALNADGADTSAANTIDWNLGNIDLATLYGANSYSSKQCVTKNYTLSYPGGSFPDGTQLLNTLSVTTNTDVTAGPIGDAIIDENIGVPTPGAGLSKSANDVLPNEDLIWRIGANVDNSNAPVPDLVVYEEVPVLPAGLTAKSITSGQWNSPATTNGTSVVEARISYATDSAGDCSNATYVTGNLSGYITSPAAEITYNNPTLPANTTCVRWEFRDTGPDGDPGDRYIPRGWRFTTNPTFVQDTTGYVGAFPVEVTNCANATVTDFLGATQPFSGCGTANIELATSETIFDKTAAGGSLKPGDTKEFTLRFRHDQADSTGPIVDPVIADVLPPEFEFVSWDSVTGLGGIGGPYPEPNLEVVDNFGAPGQTLLRYTWENGVAPVGSTQLDGSPAPGNNDNNSASFAEGADISITYTARLKPYTVAGTYTNNASFFDNAPRSTCNSGIGVDAGDLDDDLNVAEQVCNASEDTLVVSVSVLDGEKWVKGDFPTLGNVDDPATNPVVLAADCPNLGDDLGATYDGYTRFPCAAQAQHEGDFEYILRSLSIGNAPLTDYVLYDVLPIAGDKGVSELLNAIDRGSVWRPLLKGPVVPVVGSFSETAMTYPGSVIEYTTDATPCRPEVAQGSSDADWVSGCPGAGDWTFAPVTTADFATVTAFRIKIPFGAPNTWTASPANEMLFKVTMTAPVGAPPSIVDDPANFNPAWNTLAHRAFSDGGTRLLAAEPRKVGIVLPPKYRLGNLVWIDTDKDGIADAGEPGVPGIDVKLFAVGANPAVDAELAITTTDGNGHYLFSNLDAGDYFVFIPKIGAQPALQAPLNGLVSYVGGGEEANPNSDGDNNDNGTVSSVAGLASGTVTLGAGNEPTNEILRSGSATDDDNDAFPDLLSNVSVDFGFVPAVSIGSIIWNDTNNNGLQEAGELGISGATVELIDDTTGLPVAGVASQVTGASGSYHFTGLAEGDYKVRVTLPGYTKSTPQTGVDNDDTANDSNIALTAGNVHTSGMFTLSVGGEPTLAQENGGLVIAGNNSDDADNGSETNGNMTVDFGFYQNDIINPVSIGSVVWNDTNNDGVQDSNEDGIPSAVVTLFNASGPNIGNSVIGYAPITTGINGLYYFGNLPEGDYQVQVVAPANFAPSAVQESNADGNADNDSNIDTASSVGNVHKSGIVTLSNNGEPDAGANGVEAGVLGGDDQDSADDNNGNMTVDFGFFQLDPNAVSIGSLVWFDDNDNGKQDDGEQPLAGTTVKLLDGLGVRVPGITEQVTGSDGLYFFDNLPPGDYQIEVTPPAGYEPSAIQNGTGNSDVADDSNILNSVANVHTSGTFTLTVGGEPTEAGGLAGSDDADNVAEANGNMTVDFGFNQPTANAVSIGSVIWSDTNMDGIQDGGELAISGATVTLLNSNGTPVVGVNPQTTGNDGLYYFGNLPEGNYRVSVTIPAAENLAPTFVQEANADGNADNDSNIASSSDTVDGGGIVTDTVYTSGIVALVAGDEPLDAVESGALGGDTQDANDANGNMTVDFGFVPQGLLGGLSGNVSEDTNNDDLVDNVTNPNDPNNVDKPIAGVTLQLYTAAGQPVLDPITGQPVTTVTDADGNYLFDNLVPGPYQVRQLQPGGFASVSDIDGSDPLNDIIGDGAAINVLAGAIAPGNNFIERFDPTAVPTLSEWALMLLMMMLGLVGIRQASTRGGIRF